MGRLIGSFSYILGFFWSKNWSRVSGSGLKSFLDALGAIRAKYQPERSHGDPKQTFLCVLILLCSVATRDMCCVDTRDMCCVARRDMCCVARRDMCSVARRDMCSVAIRDMCSVDTTDMCSIDTVSYTHLTLPTILRV